jgi:hypothetical protein
MKNILLLSIIACLGTFNGYSQTKKVNWFITPEIGGLFLESEVGKTVGMSLGFQVWQDRLKVGFYAYGRSGPINSKTYNIEAAFGQSYKGSTALTLRADQGTFGLLIAPTFKIKNWDLDIPISLGGIAGGFYFAGDDRITPDGERVSVWENKMMDGKDAGFGNFLDVGLRVFAPTKHENIQIGGGFYFTKTQGLTTYFDPSGNFYNNKFRFSLFINFHS